MRKISSRHAEEKKQKRNQIIVGIILIFVMLGSVFGIIVGSFEKEDNSKINYNGFEFAKQNNRWILNIGNFNFIFQYNPYQVEEINSENLKYLDNYYNKPLYISSESNEAISEIYINLKQIAQRIQFACINEKECEGDLPVKTCEDNFIIIKKGNSSEIVQDENCVFIKGAEENLTEISDEFLFQITGIRQ